MKTSIEPTELESKLEDLVRVGLIPVQELPVLRRALRYVEQGTFLPANERKVFYKLVRKYMSTTLLDPTINRLIRQRIMTNPMREDIQAAIAEAKSALKKTKKKISATDMLESLYQTEDVDLKKAPEGMLMSYANSVKTKLRAGGKPSVTDKQLASKAKSELRRRRNVQAKRMMGESVSYAEKMQLAMEKFGISQLSDLSQENTKEFFNFIDNIQNSQGE
jgi:hypothetical protein